MQTIAFLCIFEMVGFDHFACPITVPLLDFLYSRSLYFGLFHTPPTFDFK